MISGNITDKLCKKYSYRMPNGKMQKGTNMKKLLLAVSVIISVIALYAITVAGASVSPALDVIAREYSMTVCGISGETVDFSTKQFFDAAGSDSFEAVKVQSLPNSSDGKLYLYDSAVLENQVIPVSDIENLTFVPEKDAQNASFRFSLDDAYTMTCEIVFDAKQNNAPVSGKSIAVNTFTSTLCGGVMTATDPDGDEVRFEIVKYPENGTLVFEKSTGAFRYTPSNTPGKDSFIYRAVDSKGAYSDPVSVTLTVMENETGTTFADMVNNEYATAAIAMTDKGIMSCSENKGKKTFSPDEKVTRLDFLVSAMNLFGAKNIPTVSDTGFVDDRDIPEQYKGLVYSAAKLGIIKGVQNGDNLYFYPNKPITPEEASVILNNVIGYIPENVTEKEPTWASEAVCAMKELGAYPVSDGATVMKRSDTAQMLYGISCLIYE